MRATAFVRLSFFPAGGAVTCCPGSLAVPQCETEGRAIFFEGSARYYAPPSAPPVPPTARVNASVFLEFDCDDPLRDDTRRVELQPNESRLSARSKRNKNKLLLVCSSSSSSSRTPSLLILLSGWGGFLSAGSFLVECSLLDHLGVTVLGRRLSADMCAAFAHRRSLPTCHFSAVSSVLCVRVWVLCVSWCMYVPAQG